MINIVNVITNNMDYRVYNGDTGGYCTYRKDSTGHFDLVHEGLPRIVDYEVEVGSPIYRYETEIRRSRKLNPWCKVRYCGDRYDYLFTEVETKTTKTRRDVYANSCGRQIVRKCRPVNTYRTQIYLNY